MSTKSVNFRIDEELKHQAEVVLDELGLSMSSALTLFLKQMVNKRALPFRIEGEDPFYSLDNQLMIAERLEEYKVHKLKEHDLIED